MRPTTIAPAHLLPTLDVPREPQQRRGFLTWERLQIAAETVFDEVGYTRATVDAITAKARVSTGTFYGYFRDKRQLLLVSIGEALDVLADDLRSFDLSPDPVAGIEQLVLAFVVHEGGYRGLWRPWAEAVAQDRELADCDQKITSWIAGILLDRMERVHEPLRLRPNLDRPRVAHLITSLLRQLSLGVYETPEVVIQAASRMIDHTLFPDQLRTTMTDEGR